MQQQLISSHHNCPFTVQVSNEIDSENHFHSELELVFLLRGSMQFALDHHVYQLKNRDFIFANPFDLHSIQSISDDCRYIQLLIRENQIRFLFSSSAILSFAWGESLNNRNESLYIEVSDALRTILMEGTNQESGYLAKCYQQIIRIMLALNQFCSPSGSADHDSKMSQNQQKKSYEIMDYINNHFTESISLDTISNALYLSQPYISKIFKETFQIGVLEYTNRLRIQKSIFALTHTEAFISDIAAECGFGNAKTFSRIFQKEMGISPTDYRKQHLVEKAETLPLFSSVQPALAEQWDYEDTSDFTLIETDFTSAIPVSFDFSQNVRGKDTRPWNKILYAGTAELLLRSTARDAVLNAVKDFDIEYIRFMGTFSDGMQTYQEDENGNPQYFWMLLDEVLHFITDNKCKPFIGLGYMPSKLAAASTPSPFHWKANTSGPKSYEKWENYLKAFLQHLVQLYSYDEVCTWYFEFWNDPIIKDAFWHGTQKSFREFFMVSYHAFRSVLPDGQFGSPGFIRIQDYQEAGDFFLFCRSQNVHFDFLSMHHFEPADPRNPDSQRLGFNQIHSSISSHGSDYLVDSVHCFQNKIQEAGYYAPIFITEWNVTPYFHDLSRDTAFMGAYIFDTINKLPDCVKSISFWSLTDYTGEHSPQQDIFSGELGLRTMNNLAKPSYLAFNLLKKMQGEVLKSDSTFFITRSSHGYHIALYNYGFYNEDFLNGCSRPLAKKDRYQIFETKGIQHYQLNLTLKPGQYRIERHILDREHGSIYDGWVRMGAPDFIDSTCFSYLNKLAYPDVSIQYKTIRGNLVFSEQVPQHGILLLSLIRLGD